MQAALTAADQLETGYDTALDQYRRQVEQACYIALKAERRYRAVDPDNRLVARGLETEWNIALQAVADAETELTRREMKRPKTLAPHEEQAILALADDPGSVWSAPTTTDRDRKQLLRTLLEEVQISVYRTAEEPHADLLLRYKGGTLTELTVPLRRPQPNIRTDEDTIALLRRLAALYPDAKIAGILNRQGRRTARGLSFTASRVQSLRQHHKIPCYRTSVETPSGTGELFTVSAAAKQLGIAASTLLRWLNDGFVAGEQITPGAPWRIRLTDELRGMLVNDSPDGWLALHHASRALGVFRQTVLQKVKRGELKAVLTRTGRRKGLRINVSTPQDTLFETPTISEGAV
ncbi:hypothetical protein [Nocardia sp. NRRL WC-3656]|uniref:hypothetical protein n=1 Tax=Nocardia sp. NRRL WC-3656 TaxID=1463824 RepID=UPI001E5E515D|nr:hypothetical protein [Nocardia sp. NRRL WC-3656]